MTSAIDECVLDFDIDLFHHSPNYELEKAQKAVALLKAKVKATNILIRKYYNKQVDCKLLEDHVIAAKEDYQNVCTENLSLRDKCAALEEQIKRLNDTCKELREQNISAVNQYEGIQSHTKQLQMLLKDKETAIESLTIENELEKVSAKECEKRNAALQKELDHFKLTLRRIRDVVLGKKQVTKEIKVFLSKYGKTDDDNTSQDENSSDEIEAFDSCHSPSCSEDLELPGRKNETSTKHTDINEDNMHTEDDSESNVVSSDTGRGSSLACSLPDSDKSLLSPEYFMHLNPLHKDKMVISIATSPISTPVLTSIATSPIIFGDNCSMQLKEPGPPPANLLEHIKSNRNISITGVSPIFTTQFDDISKSAGRNIQCKTKDSPFKRPRRVTECSFTSDYNIQEAECSDINNLDDESNDGEVQMIFDTMRLHQKLITPIPTTPARQHAAANTSTQTAHPAGACPDAAKLSEDNIALKNSLANLEQKVTTMCDDIKKLMESIIAPKAADGAAQSLLQFKLLLEENAAIQRHQQTEPKTVPVENYEVLIDTSGVTKKSGFMDKMAKMKELFGDASPFRSDEFVAPLPPTMMLSRSPSPSPCSPPTSPCSSPPTHFSPPPEPYSLPPAPPSPSPASHSPSPASYSLPPASHSSSTASHSSSPASHSSSPASHSSSPASHSPPPATHSPPRSSHSPPLTSHSSPPATHSPPRSSHSPPRSSHSPPRSSHSPPHSSHSPPLSSHSPSPSSHSPSLSSHSPSLSSHSPPPSSHSLQPAPLSPLSPARSPSSSPDNRADSISTCKSKERMRFEDPLVDREMCEHEIVVELAPNTDESERESLHAILMEQQSKQSTEPEEITVKKTSKRKISRLEKLRNNVLPKCKIKRENIPDKKPKAKLRIQPKRLTINRERVLGSAPAVDSKAAYEKACKIMAELKSENNLTNGSTVNAPNRNTIKSLKADKLPFLRKEDENLIRDCIVVVEKSPRILPVKDCIVVNDTSLRCAEKDEQSKATLKTPTKSAAISKCSPAATDSFMPELKKYGRTRRQSKCENEFGCKPEVTRSNTDHLKSPGFKTYDRNFAAKKIETNNNNVHKEPKVIEKIVYTEAAPQNRKLLKRPACDDKPEIVPKRLLRSSSSPTESEDDLPLSKLVVQRLAAKDIVSYDDLDIFSNSKVDDQTKPAEAMTNINRNSAKNPDISKHGILCTFIDKYVSKSMKHPPKVSENNLNVICKLLEDSLAQIQKLPPNDAKQGMDQLVKDLQSRSRKDVVSGLIKFLKEPARKDESYNKINVPPAPRMTKVEQILVYVVAQLKRRWPDFDVVENILRYIEYTLFMLNRAPDFDVIETLSHFYAILCRYNKNRNRLRLFIIDAMYCLMYKAVPLIKQCLDVWMHILPLAHLGLAKNPLVTCLVYLLHFYKCEDRFNRVQEIRNILHRKYFYEVSEWNEPGILEMLRNTILELREIPGEKKMIRMSLIILAKRNGATWCQKHIVNNMLLPIIEQANVPDRIKQFCVTLLGPLLKPYPTQLKVNCEIVMNQLFDILERNPTPQMEEAVYTSLIYMSRHNQYRVIRALLCWKPKSVSPEFEEILKSFVRERPVKSWRQVVSKIFIQNDFQ